jgi:hypothetical protein
MLARGLYALQLEPWIEAFRLRDENEPHNGDISTSSQGSSSGRRDGNQGTDGILVLSLKELKPNVISQTMERVCAHIGVPAFDLEDSKAKVRSIYIYY